MSDYEQKKRTRKEIDLLREGYVQALVGWNLAYKNLAREHAVEAYPYPKRTVPNVVNGLGCKWTVEGGALSYIIAGVRFVVNSNKEDLAAIREVLNKPTIEVEDDGNER